MIHHSFLTGGQMIKVYHNTGFLNYQITGVLEDPVHLAAEVATDSLDEAYELTNNIDRSWTKNPGVICHTDTPRSTSWGDLMNHDGKWFTVEMAGFKELSPEEIVTLQTMIIDTIVGQHRKERMGSFKDQLIDKTEKVLNILSGLAGEVLTQEEIDSDELFDKVETFISDNNLLLDGAQAIADQYIKETTNAQRSCSGSVKQ
jgi:hypothetical protein